MKNPQWISVSEKLPDSRGTYYCVIRYGSGQPLNFMQELEFHPKTQNSAAYFCEVYNHDHENPCSVFLINDGDIIRFSSGYYKVSQHTILNWLDVG